MLRSLHLFSFPSLLKDRTIGRRKVPAYVLWLSLCAATGGLMFGYDIGISGGVTVMDDFLCEFFPSVLEKKIQRLGTKGMNKCNGISDQAWQEDENDFNKEKPQNDKLYCLFGDQEVQLFTSSLYLSAMVATFFAAYVSRQRGRKITIIIASFFYLVGVALNIASGSIYTRHRAAFCMLIFGRIMLGIGVGFGNQAIPLFISEIAPADARGSLNYLFQLNVTIGIFFANIVNSRAHSLHPWGWRLSLGLGGVPSLLLILGSFFLVETPSSFVQRGLHGQAQEVLALIKGQGADINLALQDLILSCNGNPHGGDNITHGDPLNHSLNTSPSSTKGSIKKHFNGLFDRSNRPPLLITIFVQFFQQFSGINVVMLYAPVIFTSFGSNTNVSLLYVLIISCFNVGSTVFSIIVVDRIGRRRLLLVASGVMFFTQLLIGMILIGTNHKVHVERWRAVFLVALASVFVSAFECSWGPLAWLISTELFPLACRSEGQSVAVFFNMLFTFLIAHTSLSMLCTMKYGIFFFFALWAAIMGFASFLFLPETMNMDIEVIVFIWSYHKFWKRFVESPPPPSYIISTSPYKHTSSSFSNLEMNNIDSLKHT